MVVLRKCFFFSSFFILLFLSGCNNLGNIGKATLNTDRRNFYFSPELTTQNLTIRNIGTSDSTLIWKINMLDPAIVISPIGKRSGQLKAEQSDTLIISTTTQAKLSSKPFVIESNGGNHEIYVSFTPIPGQGLESCGSFPSSPSTTILAQSEALQGLFVPGELLVKYREPFTITLSTQAALQERARSVEDDYQLQVKRPIDLHRPALVKVSGDVLQMAARLSQDSRVAYAEPNYYLETLETPNDPLFSQQWHLSSFGLPQAWDIETGNSNNVVVAVIDSGFDMDHEDLVAKILPGCDFHNKDNDVNPFPGNTDKINHGTHVAGIVAATGNNTLGVAGVAQGAKVKILPIKVFDDQGLHGSLESLLNAILWASGVALEGVSRSSFKADVINMSVGIKLIASKEIKSLSDTIKQATNNGVVLFAASGNNNSSSLLLHPAVDPQVIAVGSVDEDYQRSSFSNYNTAGRTVDLMAPGGSVTSSPSICLGITSTIPGDQYGCLSGTSMASPFAAGVAALMLSQNPNLSPEEIKAKLIDSALFDSNFMNASEYGAGVICVDRALGASTQCGK